MHIDRIKFTKEFSYHGISEWMGCEASLEPGENPVTCILEARNKMIEAFNAVLAEKEPVVIQQRKSPLDKFEEDFEFNDVKKHLLELGNQEDAQAYLNTTAYSLTLEAKKIVSSLQPK